jgi:alpha-tubulin suppressor-like RCC1 family protein
LFESDVLREVRDGGIGSVEVSSAPLTLLNEGAIKYRKRSINGAISSTAAGGAGDMMYSWGRGRMSVLGHGHDDNIRRPTPIQALSNEGITSISSFSNHVAALDSNGRVWTWGQSNGARLGHGHSNVPDKMYTHFPTAHNHTRAVVHGTYIIITIKWL